MIMGKGSKAEGADLMGKTALGRSNKGDKAEDAGGLKDEGGSRK